MKKCLRNKAWKNFKQTKKTPNNDFSFTGVFYFDDKEKKHENDKIPIHQKNLQVRYIRIQANLDLMLSRSVLGSGSHIFQKIEKKRFIVDLFPIYHSKLYYRMYNVCVYII